MSKEIPAGKPEESTNVILAYMQAPTTLKGLVSQETTFNTMTNLKGAKMTMTPMGLRIDATDKGASSQTYYIPYTNVKSMLVG